MSTVSHNKLKYTKAQVEKANDAGRLFELFGYPSVKCLAEIVSRGDILHIDVSVADLHRFIAIYGTPAPALKGKTVHKKAEYNASVPVPRMMVTKQVLHADLFFIDRDPYLFTVSKPLQLFMTNHLGGSKGAATVLAALECQIQAYRAQHFDI